MALRDECLLSPLPCVCACGLSARGLSQTMLPTPVACAVGAGAERQPAANDTQGGRAHASEGGHVKDAGLAAGESCSLLKFKFKHFCVSIQT